MEVWQLSTLLVVLYTQVVVSHGFAPRMLVKTDQHFSDIHQLYLRKTKQPLLSYDIITHQHSYQRITQSGHGMTNCYIKFCVDHADNDDIICTPTQKFYLSSKAQWIPAYQIKIGDTLLSQESTLKQVTSFQLIKQPLTVHTIEVQNTHTYFVGHSAILTHNNSFDLLAPTMIPISGTIGALVGALGGPIPLVGFVVGTTTLCYIVRNLVNAHRTNYRLEYNIEALEQAIEQPVFKFNSTPETPPNTPSQFLEALVNHPSIQISFLRK